MINVFFLYPSKILGGAELLLYRCSIYLSEKNKKYKVHYIDYKDGYVASLLLNNNIVLLVYNNEKIRVIPGSVIITPLSYLPKLNKYFLNPHELKFLFWSINPTNLSSYIYLNKWDKFLVNKKTRCEVGTYVKYLSENGVIFYMDYNNYHNASKAFDFSFNVNYLPVFIDDYPLPHCHKPLNEKFISFMWLGRLDKDKCNTIVTFINEIETVCKLRKVKLYIVGTGSEKKYLEVIASKVDYEIVFVGRMTGKKLESFIEKEIDIGLAMGLSALEIAKKGKPVIVEGFLNKEYPSNYLKDYICICDSMNYDVVSPGYWDEKFYNTFDGLFLKIISNYDSISLACAQYVLDNHTLSVAGEYLENAIRRTYDEYNTFSYEAIKNVSSKINSFKIKVLRKIGGAIEKFI